ncbi:MAG: hypothetical protein IJN02_09855 [Bacteroidales bacterium]|nr:hypothetical protein [Bacteroidales bacterium]
MIDDWTYAAIKILIKSLMAVLLAFLVYYLGYREGTQVTGSKYDKMLIDMDLKSQERYRALLDSQNTEIVTYLDRIAELNAQHDADVEALADAHYKDSIVITDTDADDSKCDRVSVTKSDTPRVHQTSNKSDLVCYTRAELQRKIAESMAITRDADELRERYKALVKICAQE